MDVYAWVILLLVYAVIFAVACSYIAKEKGKDTVNWAIIGFFLGVIGLFIIGLSEKEIEKSDETTKKCEQCAEKVLAEAKICRFCGFKFPEIQSDKDILKTDKVHKKDFPEIPSNAVSIPWNDGKYKGEIIGGKPNGLGKWISKEGEKFIGYWNNGLMHGKVRLFTNDGNIIDDVWLEGRRQYRNLNN